MLPPILLFILFTCYQPNQGFLLDYPIESPKGSLSIFSTLTDKSTQKTWTVQETLIVTPKVHGKIEITHGNDKFQVFYHENDDEKRLVFYENECFELKFNTTNGWSSMIPRIDKPLLNMALLLGPSFYLRVVAQTNSFIAEDNVHLRGETMKNLVVRIDNSLRVSFMFPDDLSPYIGTRQPKRLALTGWIPGLSSTHNPSETLLYDIYYETRVQSDIGHSLATPNLGIGCPRYLESNQPFPTLTAKRYHVKVIEAIKTSQSTDTIHSEFLIDSRNKITRVSTVDNKSGEQKLEKLIILYNLGIKYILSPTVGTCYVVPMATDDDPSMDDNLIKMNPITLDVKDFKYVGQVSYEHRSGLVDVWESTEYNVTERDIVYGKIVTTQFMAKQSNYTDNLGSHYLPVAGERKFYKLHLEKFILSESRKRDIYDYDTVNYDETDYRQSFQLTDCYDSPDDKMYLTLQIASSDLNYKQSIEKAAGNLYLLRETIKQIIASNLNLSYLRITAIDIEFESIYILVKVEIIEAPDLSRSLNKREIKFDRKSFDNYYKVAISNPVDCLKAQAPTKNIKFVISCIGLDNICVGLTEDQPIPESNPSGSYCIVFNNRFDTLRNLVKEVTLKQLANQFTKLNGIKFNLACVDCPVKLSFSIVNVVQDSPSLDTKDTRMLFKDLEAGAKLDQVKSELVTGVRNFGDCYRACATPKDSTCETFSFCSSFVGAESYECLISENTYGSLVTESSIITNSSCSVYGKNSLLDYHKLPSIKFIEVERSSGLSVRTADECAQACVQSKETCYSFQICDSRYCSFAGHYTTSNTISDDFCEIYVPKMIQNYVKNNHQMVTPIIHSEVDLTLDQCASLCFATWQPDDQKQEDCKSFNYCPKGEATSICQLSSVTISSSTGNQVSTSDDCSNYEYIETIKQSTPSQQTNTQQQSAQQSSFEIGLLIFFVIIGTVMGLATPWAHNHLKKRFKRYNDEGLSQIQYNNMSESTTI